MADARSEGDSSSDKRRPAVPTSLANLVQQSQGGDREAFNQLMKHYDNLIQRCCWRMLRTAEEVDDAANEARLAAWHSIRNVRDPERFDSWLWSVTRGQALRIANRREAIAKYMAQDDPDVLFLDRPSLASAETLTQRYEIERAIDQLPDLYRVTLIRYALLKWSYEEIADEEHISRSAARSRVARARSELERLLGRNEGDA